MEHKSISLSTRTVKLTEENVLHMMSDLLFNSETILKSQFTVNAKGGGEKVK